MISQAAFLFFFLNFVYLREGERREKEAIESEREQAGVGRGIEGEADSPLIGEPNERAGRKEGKEREVST